MDDQATLKRLRGASTNGAAAARSNPGAITNSDRPSGAPGADPGASGVVNNVAGFGENLLTLAELQTRLTAVELRQNLASVKHGGALLLAGLTLALASLPVVLVGVADLLVSEAGMKRGYALLTVAAVSIVIAGAAMLTGRTWLSRKPLGFPLAGEEFSRNVNWLRTILRNSGRRWPMSR
jgi:uncharacterized membrane protein YqjE